MASTEMVGVDGGVRDDGGGCGITVGRGWPGGRWEGGTEGSFGYSQCDWEFGDGAVGGDAGGSGEEGVVGAADRSAVLHAGGAAQKLLFFGQYAQAEGKYRELLQKEPGNGAYAEGLLEAILRQGRAADYVRFDTAAAERSEAEHGSRQGDSFAGGVAD